LAGEDIEDYGQAIFAAAASELKEVPAEELLTRDFKEFKADGNTFAIGTVEVANPIVIEQRLPELLSTMQRIAQAHGYASFMFMVVNIIKMRCHLLIVGAEAVVADVLGVPLQADGHTMIVEGLVSRKKQLVPLLPHIQEELANAGHV
jgi:manganese-dependent inorganic pyrophosphatase